MLVAQFTYATVAEAGPYSAADGWKVKEVRAAGDASADPNDPGLRGWVEWATGSLGGFVPEAFPVLASPAEIALLPRRLRLQTDASGRVALVHQVSAGPSHHQRDSSFSHGLLVDCSDGTGVAGRRPGELWDSPGWLRPAGAEQVAAAALAATFDAGTPVIPHTDATWADHRAAALAVLAVLEHAMTPAPDARATERLPTRIAVVDQTGAETAGWAAFLGRHLTTGAAWRQLPFSTLEQSIERQQQALSAVRLIGIEPGDPIAAARALGPDWLVLDPAAPPEFRGDLGSGLAIGRGRVLPLGPWTQLVESLTLLDEMGMPSLTELVDGLAGSVAGSSDDSPLWAVPAALLTADPQIRELMHRVLPTAAALARRHWPARLSMAADRFQLLLGQLTGPDGDQLESLAEVLRSASGRGSATGEQDTVLEKYLTSLWSAGVDGAPPRWATLIGEPPWLPLAVRPSAPLAAALLDRMPELLGWALRPDVDPLVQVRALATGADLLAAWAVGAGAPEAEHLGRVLVMAMVSTLLSGTAPWATGWPVLPRALGEKVAAELNRRLHQRPETSLPPAALRWLDDQVGVVDTARPLQRWTVLDLERAAARSGAAADAENIRAAAVLRDALRQHGNAQWSVEKWLLGITAVLGPSPEPPRLRWFLQVLIEMAVIAPVLQIGERYLGTQQLGSAAHDLADWLAGPLVAGRTGADSAALPGSCPAIVAHVWCRPEIAVSGDLHQDAAFHRELSALERAARNCPEPLQRSARLRLAVDILVVNTAFAIHGSWPWQQSAGFGGPERQLGEVWAEAVAVLVAASTGQPVRRAELARDLFLRSLLSEATADHGRPTDRYSDPAGVYLRGRVDHGADEWRSEQIVRTLLDELDRGQRQHWAAQVHAESQALLPLLSGSWVAGPGQAVRGPSTTALQFQSLVEENVRLIAGLSFGARLPFNRSWGP